MTDNRTNTPLLGLPFNRRQLLRFTALGGSIAAGLQAGLLPTASADSPSALRSSLDTASPSAVALQTKTIVVLGAGISGLVTAYELLRMGYSCIVLEARDRPGGKMETVRFGSVVEETDSRQLCTFAPDLSIYFNTGPTRIPQHHAGVVGYCRELDVPLSLWQNDNRSSYFYSPAVGRVRTRQLVTSMRGNAGALAAETVSGRSDPDRAAILGVLQQFGDLNSDLNFVGSTRAGIEPGTGDDLPPNPVEVPGLAAISHISPFHQFLLNGAERLEQQGAMLQVSGGIDHLSTTLFARVLSSVRLGSVVTAINRTSTGATITYTNRGQSLSLDADYVVVTIPAPVLRTIPHSFSTEVTAALAGLHYTSAGKLAFESNRFWETDDQIYGGCSFTEDDITQFVYPSHDFGRKTGCLVGAYVFGADAGDRFAALSPAMRITAALDQGTRLHPQVRVNASKGISRSWLKTPYSLGGWSVDPPPSVLYTPDGPFLFAGDYTSYLSGWLEGGVQSAHRVVRQLLDVVSTEAPAVAGAGARTR